MVGALSRYCKGRQAFLAVVLVHPCLQKIAMSNPHVSFKHYSRPHKEVSKREKVPCVSSQL